MPEAELDLRLHRLLLFSDGVYAIAVTLLAVELVLPEAAADLHGRDLLDSLLESWPRVLAFLTSFVFIANFWAGHNVLFHRVRRFDGGGPAERTMNAYASEDFLFPQIAQQDGKGAIGWAPGFLDYLFLAFNTSAAFSPTDTPVLSRRAKILTVVQSVLSLVVLFVLVGWAVNAL
jgi:hypothetical protein